MEMKFDPMTGEPIQAASEPKEPEMKFDPMTGQPIQAASEPKEPEMKFDPMTGQPIQAAGEPKEPEMKFDPMTGQPIQAAGEPKEPEMKFDPMTGQPVQAASEPKEPEMKFDPMTGQPIQAASEPKEPEMKFDPMTGQPVQPGAQPPVYDFANSTVTTKSRGKLGLGIGIAVAVIAVGGVAFAGVKNGWFLSKSGKVALATTNTFTESSYVSKSLKGLELLNARSCTMDVDLSIEGENIEATYVATPSQKQIYGNIGIPYVGGVDFVTAIDSKEVTAQIPLLGDDVYVYNYTEKKTGYLADQLDEEEIESIDELCKMIYSGKEQKKQGAELAGIFKDHYKKLKFKSVSKEKFEVNGKDRTCKGYQTTVTEDDLTELADQVEDYFIDKYGDSVDDVADFDEMFDNLRDEFEGMDDVDVTFYIYKNKLACISLDNGDDDAQLIFHGGDRRTQNMELVADGDTVFEVRGEKDGKEEESTFYVDGDRVASLDYDYDRGEYEFNIMNSFSLSGELKNDRDGFRFTLDGDGMSIDLKISKGAELKELKGDRFDIGNASESELESIGEKFSGLDDYY